MCNRCLYAKLSRFFSKANQKPEPIQSFRNSVEQPLTCFVAGFRPAPHRLVYQTPGFSGYCEYEPQVLDKKTAGGNYRSRSPANQLLARFPSNA